MKYLYCVIPDNKLQTFDIQGIGGEIFTIPYEDISLVVSDSKPIPFATLRKDELVNYLLRHQSIIEKVMQNYSVVPLKFGTFIDGDNETQRIMKKGYKLFKEIMETLSGKIELDLVGIWNEMNGVLKEIGEIAEIQCFKDEVTQKPPGERIQGGIILGKMVKDFLDRKKDRIAEEIITALSASGGQAGAFCKHATLNDRMIFNTAFLLDKDKKEVFEQELAELDRKYEGKINFKCVGPLPPYSFATIEIKKLTPDEIFYAKAVLGIVEDPPPEEVKRAYRAMAGKLHPDKNPDNPEAAKQFVELKKAFDLLYEYTSNGCDLFSVKKLTLPT
ncbi:MAG: GvpL/GvpF family gas vesicle protein [Candidatus Margulisiibacteriota bacterium]